MREFQFYNSEIFRPEVKDLMKKLCKTCEVAVYVNEAQPTNQNVTKKSPSRKTALKLFYRSIDSQDQSFYDFSSFLCCSGSAIGSAEVMSNVFKSVLKDQLLNLHVSNKLNEDSRYEMLSTIWEDFSSSTSEKINPDTYRALFLDCSFIARCYQSLKILEKSFEIMVQLAGAWAVPEQICVGLVEITFTCSNLNSAIIQNFVTLLAMTKLSNDAENKICSTVVKELGMSKMDDEALVALLGFLESKSVWKMASEDSLIAALNRMFKSLMRKHAIYEMNVLYKIFLSCIKEDSFCARMVSSPLELSLVLRQYKSAVLLEHKSILIQIVSQFMKFDSCKYTIANTNSFVEVLKNDVESVQHVIKTYQMRKLLGLILEYRKERMEEMQNSVKKQFGIGANNDVKDLKRTLRDFSEYPKLTPKASWWQSESFITIIVEIFGVKEKRIDYTSNSISFEAYTLEDKYYCLEMKLFGEILTEPRNSPLESFSGRQAQIRVNKVSYSFLSKF